MDCLVLSPAATPYKDDQAVGTCGDHLVRSLVLARVEELPVLELAWAEELPVLELAWAETLELARAQGQLVVTTQ